MNSPDRGSYVAFVNGFGTLGGFVGPYFITLFDEKESSLVWLGLICLLSVIPSYAVSRRKPLQNESDRAAMITVSTAKDNENVTSCV